MRMMRKTTNPIDQHLARMIIVDELPFSFVEGEGFRYFMSLVQPKLNIPGRITIARDCWNLYLNEKNKLKSFFSVPNQSVCLTTDCWTSVQNLNYLCLTAHFIDNKWKLHKRILNFCWIKNHKGKTIGRKIEKCLLDWGISKVFTLTVDNGSSNDTAIDYLTNRMDDWNTHPLKREFFHVRCCAHILNLVVNDGLKDLHDNINKIRVAVRFARGSSGSKDKFTMCVKDCRLQDTSVIPLDVTTRWNSTYLMLESALKFQKPFKRLAERDVEFAKMKGEVPKSEDCDNARVFVRFLKVFYDVTLKVSGSLFVTSSQYFHEYCMVLKTLNTWAGSLDPLLGGMAVKMKAKHDNFAKLYDKNDADYLSGKVKDTFNSMFNSYKNAVGNGQSQSTTQSASERENIELADVDNSFAMEFDKDMSMSDNMNANEVDSYFKEALEKKTHSFDILNGWKVNSRKYPTLALIAKDVLAMPVSTVASESAFSTRGRVLNNYRSSLSPKTVEALVCAQNWFRSGPLSSDIEELLEEFEKLEQEMEPSTQPIQDESSDAESEQLELLEAFLSYYLVQLSTMKTCHVDSWSGAMEIED